VVGADLAEVAVVEALAQVEAALAAVVQASVEAAVDSVEVEEEAEAGSAVQDYASPTAIPVDAISLIVAFLMRAELALSLALSHTVTRFLLFDNNNSACEYSPLY